MKNILNATHSETSRKKSLVYRAYRVLLSLYLAYITYFSDKADFSSTAAFIKTFILFLFLATVISLLLDFLMRLLSDFADKTLNKERTFSLSAVRTIFLISFCLALMILGITFLSCKPGAVSYDVSNQWTQSSSGEYNNWHPVIHTLWIRFFSLLNQNYSLVIIFQIFLFSASFAYLCVSLYRAGVAWPAILLAEIIAVSSKAVRNPIMYPEKDALFTILCTLLVSYVICILVLKDEWIRKKQNLIVFGVVLGLASLVRQNGMLFTLPLLAILLIAFSDIRRYFIPVMSVFLLILCLIKCVIYPSLDVVYPNNTEEESIGLPMTIMGDTYVLNEEALSDESKDFLLSLASDYDWKNTYQIHNYNSIKFTFSRELIQEKKLTDICKMALDTCLSSPTTAFSSFNNVTKLVWGLTGDNKGYQEIVNSGDLPRVVPESGKLYQLGSLLLSWIDAVMELPPVAYLSKNIGVGMLFFLLFGLFSVYSKGKQAVVIIVPFVLYNLGTMLLLCGNDARFFHFFMTLCYPLCLFLFYFSTNKRCNLQK